MEPLTDSLIAYILDPSSVWVVLGYILLSLLSSVALYDFGALRISNHAKFKVVFIHYTVIALFFALTAFLVEISAHGVTLKAAVNICFLLIKLFIAFFSSAILYKLFKDFFLAWILKWLKKITGTV